MSVFVLDWWRERNTHTHTHIVDMSKWLMLVVRAWCAREKRTKVFRAQRAKTEIIINKLKYGPIYEWAIKIPKTKCEKKMRANATALKHFGNVFWRWEN